MTTDVKRREPDGPGGGFELSPQVVGSRYFFRPEAVMGRRSDRLVPIYGGVEECAPEYWNHRESFPFSTVEFIVGGRGTLRLGEQEWALRPGSVFAYDHRNRIDIRSQPRWPLVKYFVCVRGAEEESALVRVGLPPGTCKQVLSPFPLQRVLDDLIEEGRSARVGATQICSSLVELLLLKIGDLPEGDVWAGGVAEATFVRCRGIIDREARQLRTLGEVVSRVGVESAHLSRLFRRFQGQSPYQYLLRHKMTLAAERMVQTGCMVKEAAEYVGMDDPYHFSRLFKNLLHVAPAEFRRTMRRT